MSNDFAEPQPIVEEIPAPKPKGVFGPRWRPGESGNPKGRAKGTRNNVDVRAICEELACDPFRVLALIANGDAQALHVPEASLTLGTRLKAATELASYIAPKLKSIEIQKEDDGQTKNVYVVTLPASGRELEAQEQERLDTLTPEQITDSIHEQIARADEDGEDERD